MFCPTSHVADISGSRAEDLSGLYDIYASQLPVALRAASLVPITDYAFKESSYPCTYGSLALRPRSGMFLPGPTSDIPFPEMRLEETLFAVRAATSNKWT